jgi:hypothetical protein
MKYVKDNSIANTYSALIYYTEIHIETLHKTILERPEEFIDLVIAFLETLPKE